eukprot:TRINITY_DN13196_c0_g1_i2.p1 TRINITY_DN13196_c0_g1~~TRINITY_DN13196_c0_g1_i2.p1  ORF type:complete len:363 (-),score=89.56 TRINITY_DN13196_c0_g1_i2:254-1342(-)
MIRRPPRSTLSSSSAASDVYKRQVFNALRSNRDLCTVDVVMYTVMLDGLFRHGRNDDGWELLWDMQQNRIELDTVAFSVLMRGCVKHSQVEKALGFMEEMDQTGQAPSKVTYNTLINVCATRPDTFGHAVEWFNRMEADGFMRDAHTYRAMQQACAVAGEVEYMERVVSEMEEAGFQRDTGSFELEARTYAISNREVGRYDHQHAGYCLERAGTILDRMEAEGLQPDVQTLSSVLRVFAEAPRPGRALNLLQDPQWKDQLDQWPGIAGCNMVLNSFCKVKQLDRALELLDWMESNAIQPDRNSWKALLNGALSKKKTVVPLVQVLQRMQQKGVPMPSQGKEHVEAARVQQRLQAALDQMTTE